MLSIRKLRISIPLIIIIIIINIGIVIAATTNEQQSESDNEVADDLNVRKPPLSAKSITDRVYDGNKSGVVNIDTENWDKYKTISGLTCVVYSDILNPDLYEEVSEEKILNEQKEKIKKEKEEEEKNKFKEKDAWIDATGLNVRKTASKSASSVSVLEKGEKVTLIAEEEDSNGDLWYQIETSSGKTGWIKANYISLTEIEAESSSDDSSSDSSSGSSGSSSGSSNSSTGEEIAAYAKQYLGYSYTYGGTSPSTGFDCSGFVNYVFNHFGISMSRSSYQIATEGTAISYSNLQPGDVLAFTGDDGSIGHVGIYIGGSQFIHAQSSATGVVISSVASGTNYYSRFSSGRRFY
jgi:N-acetylmuramoyl-L-alanine amidase